MTKPERCPTHLGCPTCGSDNRAHQNCLRLSLRTDSHKHHKCDLCSDPWHTPPPATAPELRIALVSQIAELEKQIAEVGSEPIEALQKRDELYAKLSALSPSPAPIQSAEQFWQDVLGTNPDHDPWPNLGDDISDAVYRDVVKFAEAYAASLHSNPDLEKQFIIQRDRAEEFAKQVAEQQREIERLQEYPARYAKLLKERDSTIQRYKTAIDAIYNTSQIGRDLVLTHFGRLHDRDVSGQSNLANASLAKEGE